MQSKKSPNIVVSVIMITYRHEKYIKQAIEGVLMQQCDFLVELIVANDCSPDDTDEVVNEIINNHPNSKIIKYTNHIVNKGANANFLWAVKQAKGKYIALCEGDDYWIDPLKLQKQVEFLEGNNEYIIHSGNIIRNSQNELIDINTSVKQNFKNEFLLNDFFLKNHLYTCTVLFRNFNLEFPNFFNTIVFGDWMLYIILLKQSGSKAYKSNEIYSVYRIHENGIMNSINEYYDKVHNINQILKIKKYVNYSKIPNDVKEKLNTYFIKKIKIELKDKKYLIALSTFFRHLFLIKDISIFKNNIRFILRNLIKRK